MNRIRLFTAAGLIAAAGILAGCSDETVQNTYTVPASVEIQTPFIPDASQGDSFSFTMGAAGGSGVYSWSIEPGGTNDAWLSIDANTGELTGTSNLVFAVTLIVRAQDVDDSANYDEAVYSFNVTMFAPTLTFTTTNPLPAAGVNQAYSQSIQVTGGSGSYSSSIQAGGVNDSWLSIAASTGLLSGTPTATGNTEVVIRAVDDANALDVATMTFHIEIKNIAITTASISGAFAGQPYSCTLAAIGGSTPYSWSLRFGGTNYAWLSINGTTGELTGNPTTLELGPVEVIVRVDDSGANNDIRLYQISVSIYNPPIIGLDRLPNAYVNTAYSRRVSVSGGNGPLKFSIKGGSNHEWLSINQNTGVLSGTPATGNMGTGSLDVRVEEIANPDSSVEKTLSFEVLGVEITTTSLPFVETNGAYSCALTAVGGVGHFSWTIVDASSANHSWLSIDPDDGTLTGTGPSTVLEVTLTVNIEDSLTPTLTHQKTFHFPVIGTVLVEGFESGIPATWTGNGNWTAGAASNWYIAPNAAQEGGSIIGTNLWGKYTANRTWGTCDLTTSQITLPATTNPIFMSYYQWFQCSPDDGCILQIDDDGTGATWNDLTPITGYTGTVDAGGANKQGFTGYGGNAGLWRRVLVDLSAFQGSTRLLRFSFFSDATVQGPGMYIDNIRIFTVVSTALPEITKAPFPAHGVMFAPPQSADYAAFPLRWRHSLGAFTGYDVYAGTDYNAVLNANTSSGEYLGQVATAAYTDTAGTFSSGNTFFWRVDAVNATGVTKGEVWTFYAADPVQVLINEVFAYVSQFYPDFVEVFNHSGVAQDVSGWTLEVTSAGASAGVWTFPQGSVVGPRNGLVVAENRAIGMFWTPRMGHMAMLADFDFGWTATTSEGEVIFFDPAGGGLDYVGFNVVTSNLPTDLLWFGTLSGMASNYAFYRTSKIDTDYATEWAFGLIGSGSPTRKNPGQ